MKRMKKMFLFIIVVIVMIFAFATLIHVLQFDWQIFPTGGGSVTSTKPQHSAEESIEKTEDNEDSSFVLLMVGDTFDLPKERIVSFIVEAREPVFDDEDNFLYYHYEDREITFKTLATKGRLYYDAICNGQDYVVSQRMLISLENFLLAMGDDAPGEYDPRPLAMHEKWFAYASGIALGDLSDTYTEEYCYEVEGGLYSPYSPQQRSYLQTSYDACYGSES